MTGLLVRALARTNVIGVWLTGGRGEGRGVWVDRGVLGLGTLARGQGLDLGKMGVRRDSDRESETEEN